MRNPVLPCSASASRTTGTCSAKAAVVWEPAPMKPSPRRTARRSAARGVAAEPQRRVGLLERLRLHGRALDLPEAAGELHLGLRPQRFHQLEAFGEAADERLGHDAEGREHPPPAGADADLDAAPAQLVERADALGQVDGAVQRGDQHRAAESQRRRAGGGVGHGLERAERGHRAQHLLLRPGALEAQFLGPGQEALHGVGIEGAVLDELGDADGEAHGGRPYRLGAGGPPSAAGRRTHVWNASARRTARSARSSASHRS